MRRFVLALLALLVLGMVGDHAVLAQNNQSINDNCDPSRRKDNPNLQRAKEAKKAQLRARGYPERFMKLIDREECIACVEQASDAFHIMLLYKDNDYAPTDKKTGKKWTHVSFNWDPGSEVIAREKTKDGSIKGFLIYNTATKGCLCCPDMDRENPTPESFSDWDEDNGVNKDHVIPFDESNLGPLPDDLTKPDERWVGDPLPEIESFTKPVKKQAHAPCKACEGDVAKLNAAYDAVDALWDQKIEQLTAQQQQSIEHAQRENEIRLLWYRQRSATMRSDANAKRIDELEAINERAMSDMRARVSVIEALDARIAAHTAETTQLEMAAAACARQCTTLTDAPQQVSTSTSTGPPPPTAAPPRDTPPPNAIDPPALPPVETFKPVSPNVRSAYPEPRSSCAKCVALLEAAQRAHADVLKYLPTNDPGLGSGVTYAYNEAMRRLAECEKSCANGAVAPPPAPPRPPATTGTISTPYPQPQSRCGKCASLLEAAQRAHADILKYLPTNDPGLGSGVTYAYNEAMRRLAECEKSCPDEAVVNTPPPGACVGDACGPARTECFGDSCASTWTDCTNTESCMPVETDCGIPGACTDSGPPNPNAPPLINLGTDVAWTTSINVEIEIRVQEKLMDVLDPPSLGQYYRPYEPGQWRSAGRNETSIVVEPYTPKEVRRWFDPLGLIARTLGEYVERWRGSMAPRPIVMKRDLDAVARYSSGQAAGLPAGVHVLLTDRGGSTGKTIGMQILNLTGRPIRLASRPFAVQPIKQAAQQKVQDAFSRLAKAAPPRIDLNAYCLEFLKAPPGANTLLRLAPQNIQQKYAPMTKVLQSAYRVAKANGLRPDSNPAAYTDAIKQWAVWTVEQKLNQQRFTEAFLGHTRKNVEAAGQKWSPQADDMIRKASPNRWNDIVKILRGAGVPVPQ